MKSFGYLALYALNNGAFGALLALKLSHVVTWSWWIILLPFEVPLAFGLAAVVLYAWRHRWDNG